MINKDLTLPDKQEKQQTVFAESETDSNNALRKINKQVAQEISCSARRGGGRQGRVPHCTQPSLKPTATTRCAKLTSKVMCMICVRDHLPEPFYQSNIFRFYFDGLNVGVVDIETTGLSPARSRFVLGGLVAPDVTGKSFFQAFAESTKEEAALLRAYLFELRNFDVLISYNGDHFDFPFLRGRLGPNRIPEAEFPVFQSLDLYRILDRHSDFRKLLPNLKQKTVETFLGLWADRTDEISGADSVELYYRYLRTGDAALRDEILLHNRDDIFQLSRLLKAFEKLDIHKIMFHGGFLLPHRDRKIHIQGIRLEKGSIRVSGAHQNIPMDYKCWHASHEGRFSAKEQTFTLRIPWKSKGNCFYVDLEEFPYDCAELEKYPACTNGFLIAKNGDEISYAEINHLIKILLKEILDEL
jgi:uncharacterized protein YprB with RNaseH-like and TPR domain